MALTDRGYNRSMGILMEDFARVPRPVRSMARIVILLLAVAAVLVTGIVGGWVGVGIGLTVLVLSFIGAWRDRQQELRRRR